MNQDEAIEKAGKLLRLATSSNPHEAALAASRAQDIIDRYKLGNVTLSYDDKPGETDEPIRDFCDDPLFAGRGRIERWRWCLFLAVAKGNQCKGYSARGRGIAVVGRPSDVATVRYFYNWLCREVEQLAQRDGKGYGATYLNNYRLGVVDTIKQKLEAQHAETVASVKAEATATLGDATLALVRVNTAIARIEQRTAEVEDWVKTHLRLGRGSSSRSSYNPGARAAGRAAGQSISIRRRAGSIGGGVKQIHG